MDDALVDWLSKNGHIRKLSRFKEVKEEICKIFGILEWFENFRGKSGIKEMRFVLVGGISETQLSIYIASPNKNIS